MISVSAPMGQPPLGRRSSSEKTAVLSVFVLATSYLFWDKARSAQIDAVLCCLIWVALSAFETWRAGDLGGRRAGLVFWAAGALAVLAETLADHERMREAMFAEAANQEQPSEMVKLIEWGEQEFWTIEHEAS